jgi:hypothetical protein
MRADNSPCLLAAARQRTQDTTARAEQALQQLTAAGEPVTIAEFAAAAGVSRSWIYTQPALLERIAALARHPSRPGRGGTVPAAQRASTASLHRRLELAHQRIQQLNTENQQLRAELARAYGQLRAGAITSQPR